jgi:hypothetical protein
MQREMRHFQDSFLYQDDVGCMAARLSPRWGYDLIKDVGFMVYIDDISAPGIASIGTIPA